MYYKQKHVHLFIYHCTIKVKCYGEIPSLAKGIAALHYGLTFNWILFGASCKRRWIAVGLTGQQSLSAKVLPRQFKETAILKTKAILQQLNEKKQLSNYNLKTLFKVPEKVSRQILKVIRFLWNLAYM